MSAVQDQVTSTDKFTQELRLVSAESDTFEWLLGAYYTDEDSGIDPQKILVVESGTDTLATDIPPMVEATVLSTYEELALFANATWHITPRFDLSFGARASDNDQEASQVFTGALFVRGHRPSLTTPIPRRARSPGRWRRASRSTTTSRSSRESPRDSGQAART